MSCDPKVCMIDRCLYFRGSVSVTTVPSADTESITLNLHFDFLSSSTEIIIKILIMHSYHLLALAH